MYGGLTRGPRVIEENLRKNTKEILEEITFRKFAKERKEWILENISEATLFLIHYLKSGRIWKQGKS